MIFVRVENEMNLFDLDFVDTLDARKKIADLKSVQKELETKIVGLERDEAESKTKYDDLKKSKDDQIKSR